MQTLVGLAILAATLYAFQGILDVIRGRIIVRIGAFLDENVSGRVYETIIRLPLKSKVAGDGLQPLRDLDQLRGFLSGGGPLALFDLPWMPVYLGICFIFHVWIGVAALAGALILVALTVATELRTRGPLKEADRVRRAPQCSRRSGAGGMRKSCRRWEWEPARPDRWGEANAKYMSAQRRASDVSGGLGAIIVCCG